MEKVTTEQITEILGVNRRTFERWMSKKIIPYEVKKVSNKRVAYYDVGEVKKALKDNKKILTKIKGVNC